MKFFKKSFFLTILFLVSACAAMKLQVTETHIFEPKESTAKIEHTFYLIGDTGNSTLKKDSPALKYLKEKTKNVSKKSTLIFLGDNVYEMGIPKKKKSRGKTTIIAMHHPMCTNDSHGEKYSFASHMNPLPILGSLKNLIRQTSGLSNTDIQNKKYNALKKRIVKLV